MAVTLNSPWASPVPAECVCVVCGVRMVCVWGGRGARWESGGGGGDAASGGGGAAPRDREALFLRLRELRSALTKSGLCLCVCVCPPGTGSVPPGVPAQQAQGSALPPARRSSQGPPCGCGAPRAPHGRLRPEVQSRGPQGPLSLAFPILLRGARLPALAPAPLGLLCPRAQLWPL